MASVRNCEAIKSEERECRNGNMAVRRDTGVKAKTLVRGNKQKDPSVGSIGLEDIGRPEQTRNVRDQNNAQVTQS